MEDFIAMCKKRTTEAMDRFLNDLSFVPAGKLTWSPTPTAKFALEIAAHCSGYSGSFASIVSAGSFPWTAEEFRSPIQSLSTTRLFADGLVPAQSISSVISLIASSRSKVS